MIFAPKFPIEFNSLYGFDNVDNIKQLIFFHLKNVLFTFPGEKLSDPSYGVGIKSILFEMTGKGFLNNVADIITEQIERYLGYLNLKRVTVAPISETEIRIAIAYSIPNLNVSDIAVFDLADNI